MEREERWRIFAAQLGLSKKMFLILGTLDHYYHYQSGALLFKLPAFATVEMSYAGRRVVRRNSADPGTIAQSSCRQAQAVRSPVSDPWWGPAHWRVATWPVEGLGMKTRARVTGQRNNDDS